MDPAPISIPNEFVPQPPINVPPPPPPYHPYFQKMLGPFLTVLILGVITFTSAGLLYRTRQENISPSAPSRSSAAQSPAPRPTPTVPGKYTIAQPTPVPVAPPGLWQKILDLLLRLFKIKD